MKYLSLQPSQQIVRAELNTKSSYLNIQDGSENAGAILDGTFDNEIKSSHFASQ